MQIKDEECGIPKVPTPSLGVEEGRVGAEKTTKVKA
jgi:hypothetical protein